MAVGLAGTWSAIRIIQKLGAQNMRRDLALNNMIQGLCMFDGQHRLVVWNRAIPDDVQDRRDIHSARLQPQRFAGGAQSGRHGAA